MSRRFHPVLPLLMLLFLLGSCGEKASGDASDFSEPPITTRPKLGITILPAGQVSEWTDASFTDAFRKAREGGFRVAVWRHQWGDLEPTLGSYQWSDLDYEVWKTQQQGMEHSLVLEVIHTNTLGDYPSDLSFSAFDDPAFVEPFKRFIRSVLERYPGKIDYLWLGNEVDFYLHEHPDQVTPFLNLYREMEQQVRSIDPGIVVGIVGAYHLARNNGEIPMLQMFAREGDAIGLTLYMEDDDAAPEVADTPDYFDELLRAFPDTRVAIIETSWSSAGSRGSEQRQADYVRGLAQVLRNYRQRFLFFSWFILHDLPEDLNRQIAASFGVCPAEPPDPPWCTEFLSWQGSLAMLRNDGSEKPAWAVWKEELKYRVYLPLVARSGLTLRTSPWPMFQHDERHTGRSPYRGPAERPDEVWSHHPIGYGIFGSPAIDEQGRIFIGTIHSLDLEPPMRYCLPPYPGNSGILYAYSPGGEVLWSFDSRRGSCLAAAIEGAPLLLSDGSLVFGKDDGYVYRLDAAGRLIWEFAADDPFDPARPLDDNEQFVASPVLGAEGTIYIASIWADVYLQGKAWWGKLYAIDATSGRRKWVFDPSAFIGEKQSIWSSPALGSDGTIYFASLGNQQVGKLYTPYGSHLFALRPDGSVKWVYPTGRDEIIDTVFASPTVGDDGTVYIGTQSLDLYGGSAQLLAFTPDGTLKWRFTGFQENAIIATPALTGQGLIIVGTQHRQEEPYGGAVYALRDLGRTAELVWRYPAEGQFDLGMFASPLVDADDRVYFANERFPPARRENVGTLRALSREGELLWEHPLPAQVHGSLALAADGTLYVVTQYPDARLMALR